MVQYFATLISDRVEKTTSQL